MLYLVLILYALYLLSLIAAITMLFILPVFMLFHSGIIAAIIAAWICYPFLWTLGDQNDYF